MFGPSRINNDVATRKKGADEKAKERRKAKDSSSEGYPCEDITRRS